MIHLSNSHEFGNYPTDYVVATVHIYLLIIFFWNQVYRIEFLNRMNELFLFF